MFKGFFNFSKTFILSKLELGRLSEQERGMVKGYRESMDMLRREAGAKPVTDSMATFGNRDDSGNENIYLYDFLQQANNTNGTGIFSGTIPSDSGATIITNVAGINPTAVSSGNGQVTVALSEEIKKVEARVYKPIEVFTELHGVPNPINLENLDDKILVLKMKKDLISYNKYAQKEVIDMVMRLENRKKWNEFKSVYEKYQHTTTDKINTLLTTYNLVLKSSDLFISKFPREAIFNMQEYTETTQKLCGKKPVYYVIAEQSMFKEEDRRNDPIILAQSPFGMFWQILGAYDKELVLLDEL